MSRTRTVRSSDEGGSILPLVALIMVTLMTASAFAIDLGSVAATNRRLQAVADLAASAAASELSGDACDFRFRRNGLAVNTPKSLFQQVHEAAKENAAKNGFPEGADKTLVVETGILQYSNTGEPTFQPTHSSLTGPDCVVSAVPAAVRVTAGDYTKFAFGNVIGMKGMTTFRSSTSGRKNQNPGQNGGGGTTTTTTGGSTTTTTTCKGNSCGAAGTGGFDIGSSLASLNSESSAVLSSVLNGMVCRGVSGCSFSTTLAGYQGLATAGVTLDQLRAQVGVGSVGSLLDANLKMSDLYLASARALGCATASGCSNAAALTLFGLATSVTSSATFKLRNMITVAVGSEAAAAAATFSILRLVTGSATVINGVNTVSIPVTTVTIPGSAGTPTSTTLTLKVTAVPQSYSGQVGGGISTSQVELTVNQQINLLNIPITGSLLGNLATVTGTVPFAITAGSAKGTLAAVRCASNKGQDVVVDTSGATTAIGNANASTKFLDVRVAGVRVAGLNVNGTTSVAGVNGNLLSFSYPSEYRPDTTDPKHVGGTKLNVQGTAISSSLDAPLLTLNATALTTALTGPTGTATAIDTALVSPVLRALGVDVGGADVWATRPPGCLGGAPFLGPPR